MALIEGLFNSGSIGVLERTVQFTHQRHQVIVDSIANLSTPNYQPADLDVKAFREALSEAVENRRKNSGGPNGELQIKDTSQLQFAPDRIEVRRIARNENILFHDRNNRSLEHIMQDLAENAMAHNGALEMLRNQFGMLESVIRERP